MMPLDKHYLVTPNNLKEKENKYDSIFKNSNVKYSTSAESVAIKSAIIDLLLSYYDITPKQLYKLAKKVVIELSLLSNITHNLSVLYQHIKP